MTALYTILITRLIAWLHGLSRSDFDKAVALVRAWAAEDISGAQKALKVRDALFAWFTSEGRDMGTAAVNVLIELAVSYARKAK
jgi:hypothetical protein